MSLITYLTRIHFADRVLEDALGEEMRNNAMRRPLLISDLPGDEGPDLDRLEDALPLDCNPICLYQRSSPPGIEAASSAAQTYADQSCDGIIGFGGASALDLARLTGAVISSRGGPGPVVPGPARSSKTGRARPGSDVKPVPVLAIPTTLASVGLEPLAVPPQKGSTMRAVRRRIPVAILCDPTLARAKTASEAAAAGIDILSHCVEAYLGTTFNPPADGMALEGARRIAAHLQGAVDDTNNLNARRELLAAAVCAGLSAEKGLGGVEALSSALEIETGLAAPHGHFHAALIKPVLGFNAPAVSHRFGDVLGALGLPPGAELSEELVRIGAGYGLPQRLAEAVKQSGSLSDATLRRAASRAASHAATRTNPRHATEQDYLTLLETAM
jgi:4-hydroxybutyrate dehydrogenase